MSIETSEAEALGRRERKKLATRQALHEAALALAEEHGLLNVTVEAITNTVDVAPRTFFNYYSSKEEAVIGPESERPERIASVAGDRLAAGDPPLAALRAAVVADALARNLRSEDLRRRQRLMRHEPALFAVAMCHWEEIVRRLVDLVGAAVGRDPATDMYPALVVNVAVAAYRSAIARWVDDPAEPIADAIDAAFAAVAAGLPSPSQPSHQQGAHR